LDNCLGLLRPSLIVLDDQFDLLAVYAASGIDLIDRQLNTIFSGLAKARRLPVRSP